MAIASVKSETDIPTSWVNGCRKMPSDCRRPMLRLSISEAPIRIGSVGRRSCSRGIFLVLPLITRGSKIRRLGLDYTDLCNYCIAGGVVKPNSTQVCVTMPLPQKTPMKERILETADRLFYRRGIRAVGVDTIAAEIGISKRTLYNHFPSKDELIAAYLARRFVQPRPSDKPAAEQILGTFDSLERRFASKGFRGCPFVNAVAELGAEDKSVKKIAIAFKESRRVWFRDLLLQLDVTDADEIATQLPLLVAGAIATDLVRDDPSSARAAKDAARVLLKNAGIAVDGQDVQKSPRRTMKKRASASALSTRRTVTTRESG